MGKIELKVQRQRKVASLVKQPNQDIIYAIYSESTVTLKCKDYVNYPLWYASSLKNYTPTHVNSKRISVPEETRIYWEPWNSKKLNNLLHWHKWHIHRIHECRFSIQRSSQQQLSVCIYFRDSNEAQGTNKINDEI